MQVTPHFVIRSAAVAAVGLALVAGWGLIQEPRPLASCRLADGSVLRLEALTRGPEHRFKCGPYWQRLLACSALPALRNLAGDPPRVIRSDSANSLVFWTSRAGSSPFLSDLQAEVVNERGCSYPATYALNTAVVGSHWLEGVQADVIPWRGRKLGVRFCRFVAADRKVTIAELFTRNRWSGPIPTWQPERLPATRRDGDLTVTLTSLTTRAKDGWTIARFRYGWKGKVAEDWVPVDVRLSDPTGNHLHPQGTTSDPDEKGPWIHFENSRYAFEPSFCQDEPVWKLRLAFAKTGPDSIDRSDLWMTPALPIPRPRVYVPASGRFSRYGVALHLLGIGGPGAVLPGRGRDPSDGPTVHYTVTPSDPMREPIFVRAVDDRGRATPPPGYVRSSWSSDGDCTYTVQPARSAKSVSLMLGLVKNRFVEFVVRPSRT